MPSSRSWKHSWRSAAATGVAEVDLAVYDQYLKARQLMRGRAEQDLQQASSLLDQVIARDPEYAPALAQRAIVELMLSDQLGRYGSIPMLEALDNAEGFTQRALVLEPDDPDALAAQGTILLDRGDLAEGTTMLERALELSPNHTNAMNWLAGAYGQARRLRLQFEMRERLYRVDPLYPPGVGNLMGEYMRRGEPEKMQQLLDSVTPYLSGSSLNYVKAVAAWGSIMQGQEAEAIRLIDSLPPGERGWGEVAGAIGYTRLLEYERALPYVEGLPPTVTYPGTTWPRRGSFAARTTFAGRRTGSGRLHWGAKRGGPPCGDRDARGKSIRITRGVCPEK